MTQSHNAFETYGVTAQYPWRVKACCMEGQQWGSPDCSWLCMMSTAGLSTMMSASFGTAAVMMFSLLFIPPQLWSPIALPAARKTKDTHMWRLLHLPLPLMVIIPLNMMLFGLYVCHVFMEEALAHAFIWEAVFVVTVALFAGEVAVLVWVLPWQHMLETPVHVYRYVTRMMAAALVRPADQPEARTRQQPAIW
mmetsp:Transcript_8202/g.23537  ORF Transcript_8202/g.23537 Transcript_8202/m.23537 type:complete len:194 (-) Transcript_8202:890-1471(-)